MTRKEKQNVVLEVARSYYRRGHAIQYDQLSMDRLVRITPRKWRGCSPELATAQHMVFLDCSTYVWTVYHEAFGFDMKSDLTWFMAEIEEYRKFYYEITHNETDSEREAIAYDVRSMLEPGDLIVYAKKKGSSGHIMLYTGGEDFLHCCWAPEGGDYMYAERRNRMRAGGIEIGHLDALFCKFDGTPQTNRSLFQPDRKCFAVLRPLDVVGEPTDKTRLRMGKCRGLDIAVLSSVYGGKTVEPGEELAYTVEIQNYGETVRDVAVTFDAPAGAYLTGERFAHGEVPAGRTQVYTFTVRVEEQNAPTLESPAICVNDMVIDGPQVAVGKCPTDAELSALLKNFAHYAAEKNAYGAARKAYAEQGVALPELLRNAVAPLFAYFDSMSEEVVYRLKQIPAKDKAAYAQFGGIGVITPEVTQDGWCRNRYITQSDLMPGDLIVVFDDAMMDKVYASFYDGAKLQGQFGWDGAYETIAGQEMLRYIDSLQGQFGFIVLRPFLSK